MVNGADIYKFWVCPECKRRNINTDTCLECGWWNEDYSTPITEEEQE